MQRSKFIDVEDDLDLDVDVWSLHTEPAYLQHHNGTDDLRIEPKECHDNHCNIDHVLNCVTVDVDVMSTRRRRCLSRRDIDMDVDVDMRPFK